MKRWFYLVVGLQILFLFGEVAKTEIEVRLGRVVTLKVAPVDPRSLFMGNYMNLDYDISSIDLSTVRHDAGVEALSWGDTVYVILTPRKPWAVAEDVRLAPPAAAGTAPYLRGRVQWVDHPEPPAPGSTTAGPGVSPIPSNKRPTIRIEYGLERYFIPETKQEAVNRLQWGRPGRQPQITVEISVTEKGKGLIRRVLVDGKPLGF